ncbi:MAG: hypothetical protein JST04_06090 [Bdellovibrionales bacterium]|nr:hypothetical protein [Bdellovibrionales bacterium]
MKTNKYVTSVLLGALLALVSLPGAARAGDPYQDQLNRLREEMTSFGMSIDVFGENPFQTGTSLGQYYLNEKTLLLETKSFFQTKANDLSSTDAVADMQFRNKVLRSHANNILIQLSQAIRNRKDEGFLGVEAPKQKETLDKVLDDCQKDAACVARTLENKETAVENVIVTNLEAAKTIFDQMPYMQSMEVMAAYQMTQMLYLEVLKNQARVADVEFDLYYQKEKALVKAIGKNPALSDADRKMQIALANNTINKWKKAILDRRNSKEEFFKLAKKIRDENQGLASAIVTLRKGNPNTLGNLYDPKRCRGIVGRRRRHWCEGQDALQEILAQTAAKKGLFVDEGGKSIAKETELPAAFFEKLN